MDEFISREAAVEKITFLCELREIVSNPDDEFLRGLKIALNAVRSDELIPYADVQPVKRGKWLKRMSTSDSLKCSVCGNNHEYETAYCPMCGARMDGDKK